MAKVQVTKDWTISPNVRLTPYVSLNATMGWWLYENKTAMLAAGWTVIFSSDGTTGPADANDDTDRWASAASGPLTRATIAAAVQSWIVLENVDGLQVLFTYQGATDDVCRVSMSQGGLFTLAGTTTHQPTATDEVIATFGTSVINATTSADRVMSIGCTDESWWVIVFRAGSYVLYLSVDKIDTACDSTTLAVPYVVAKLTNPQAISDVSTNASTSGPMSGNMGIAQNLSTWYGIATRVVTSGTGRIIRVGGGSRCAPGGASLFPMHLTSVSGALGTTVATPPALNGTTIPILTIDWFGEKTANMDGYLGSPIDWWYGHTSAVGTPAAGDMIAALAPGDTQASALRSNWLVAIGSGVIRPWLNAAASMQFT